MAAPGTPGPAAEGAQTPATSAWAMLQKQYYGGRDLGLLDKALMSLDVPSTTADPAATPLSVRFGEAAIGRIRQLRVIIDNNPSPLAATLDFPDGARVAQIDLRVRVDRLTSIRAIAETADGTLEMRSSWVNASGGCSAGPAIGGTGTLGELRFWASPDAKSLQVGIRHPNNSGFQIDPVSGDPIPAHYITHLSVSAGGRLLVDADTGISISENPTLRIASDMPLPANVMVEATDSRAVHYRAAWAGGVAGSP